MKLLFENWKRFLKEGPLDDFAEYSEYETPKAPSIGYGLGNETFVKRAKEIMAPTGDNWVIITVGDVSGLESKIDGYLFQSWLKEKNYPKGTKIIVVGSVPYEDDYIEPEWILHDILGHSIGNKYFAARGARSPDGWLSPYTFARQSGSPILPEYKQTEDLRKNVVNSLLQLLPQDMFKAEVLFDRIYDIFGAIAMGQIKIDQALPQMETEEEKELTKDIFDFVDSWVNNFPRDKPTILTSW